jgi:hypothetical protein
LLAFGLTRKTPWLIIFISLGIGLLIRRLTFVNAYHPINLPERWIFAIIAFLGCLGYLCWRNTHKEGQYHLILIGLIFFIPNFCAILFCHNVTIRAGLLLVCFLLLIVSNRIDTNSTDVWLVLYPVLFLIGTSMSVGQLTHLVIIPILLSAFSIDENTTVSIKAILLGMLMWILYFLPGNGFDFKLLDLTDKFIMSSANNQDIGYTVLVVVCRYFLPVTFFFICLFYNSERKFSSVSTASAILLPIVLCIGAKLYLMGTMEIKSVPWEDIVRIMVLSGFALSLVSGQIVSILVRRYITDRFVTKKDGFIKSKTKQMCHFWMHRPQH